MVTKISILWCVDAKIMVPLDDNQSKYGKLEGLMVTKISILWREDRKIVGQLRENPWKYELFRACW